MDIVAAPGRRPRSDAPQPQDASGLTWARKEEPCGGVVARTVGAGAAQRRSLDDVQDGLFLDAGNLAALEISTRHLPGAAAMRCGIGCPSIGPGTSDPCQAAKISRL